MKSASGFAAPGARQGSALNVAAVRADFPILKDSVHGRPLVYLDNAATTQKPRAVTDAVTDFYAHGNSNVHRGVHWLSQQATERYEAARASVQTFLGARSPEEIVFVRGATEGINLVAQTYGRARVGPGDEVLITAMEHHSNIVPWQMLCEERGAMLRVAPINDSGELAVNEFARLLSPKTRLAAITHMSNALGTINPVAQLVETAHARGVPVLVDGAQAAAHLSVDVSALDCDFYVFSGHKVYGPTGIGALYGKAAHLAAMPPYQGGGDMILDVSFERTIYNKAPFKFEAGTPHISGAIGLAAAIDYIGRWGKNAIAEHETALTRYALEKLAGIDGLRFIGTARERTSVVSFVLEGIHPHDIGTVLDQEGIAIRTGHHCAQPIMSRFGVPATARASLAMYNTRDEIDALAAALRAVVRMFNR
jgi:cysteine desulfurase/selenocysteine lyase